MEIKTAETTMEDVASLAGEGQALILHPRPFASIDVPDHGKILVAELREMIARAESMVSNETDALQVVDAAGYEQTRVERDNMKSLSTQLNEKRMEITRPFDEAKGKVKEFVDNTIYRLLEGVNVRDSARKEYKTEQERLRLEEENRRKAAIAEQERKLREEQARIEAESRRKAAELELKAAEAREAGKVGQAAKYEQRAASTVEAAQTKADVLQQTLESLPPATVASSVPDGGFRKAYKPRIVSLDDFICAVADGIRSGAGFPPASYLAPNMVAIGRYCDSTKDAFKLPGFELSKEDVPVSQRRSKA